jgi:DNA-directed RNA polymerase specialized sigma24 family protein
MIGLTEEQWGNLHEVLMARLAKYMDEQEIEDLVQDTQVDLLEHSEKEEVTYPFTLAFQIAHRRLVDHLRHLEVLKQGVTLADFMAEHNPEEEANGDGRDPETVLIERADQERQDQARRRIPTDFGTYHTEKRARLIRKLNQQFNVQGEVA